MQNINYLRSSLIEALPARFCSSLGQMAEKISRARARHAVYRRTFDELQALSDRELRDINMHRSNIRGVALEASRKDMNHG